MKFVFEATIGEFNEAAEYGILLRKASRQKRANIIGLSICVLALIIVQALTAQYDLDKVTITEIYLLAAMTAVLVMDRGGSLTRKALRMFFRGQLGQTAAERSRVVRVVLEPDHKFHTYCNGQEESVWDCGHLSRALECPEVFDLIGGGKKKTALSLPKGALKEGTMEEFTRFLNDRLPKNKTIRYYEIPQRLRDCLKEEKAKVRLRG